jgi:hypothetical protein
MVDAFMSHVGGRLGTCAAVSEASDATAAAAPRLRILNLVAVHRS